MTTRMCIDAATDREMMEFGLKMSRGSCKRFDTRRAGATWVIDAECAFGPVKSVTKTTISGDFQSPSPCGSKERRRACPARAAGRGPR